MLEKTNSKLFTFLLGFSAFMVATAAAVFSVTGLSMLYSGEMFYVALAMGALEFAKIITASFLYRYWKTTGWGLKTYLSVAVFVLMIVTSGGIYGYLTNSYQGATVGLDKINSQSQVLNQRKENLTAERERLVSDIATLRAERQSTIENRNNEIAANNIAVDSNSVKYRAYRNKQVHTRYNEELTRIDDNVSNYTTNLDSTTTRLSRINNDIADKSIEMIDTGVDVGPLVYMARIFNTTMDTVMKWFTLVIVFVFDPLAIALIVAYNSVIMRGKGENDEKSFLSEINKEIEDLEKESEVEVDEVTLSSADEFEDEDDEPDVTYEGTIIGAKPIEHAFDDIQEKIDEQKKDIVELDEDFAETLDEVTEKVGQDEPTKPRFEEPKEERVVLEPAKLGDIPKEKIIEAVKSVREKQIDRKNEFFDKMRDEKKSPITSDEIRDYFEDAVRKVKKEGQGIITTTPFQAGGSVIVDHLQDDPDIDYSIQE